MNLNREISIVMIVRREELDLNPPLGIKASDKKMREVTKPSTFHLPIFEYIRLLNNYHSGR